MTTPGNGLTNSLVDFVCNDIARVAIALTLLIGTLGLLFVGRQVPDVLWALDSSAVTFYFTVTVLKNGTR